jgi:PIN domain nuclease of toxin-antitoxin system
VGFRVKLLLDTCVFIWLTQEPNRISSKAARAIDDPLNELFFSHASIWEIHLKNAAGKLKLPDSSRAWITKQLTAWAAKDWNIDLESLHRASELPAIHKDPFDRLLVGQALTSSMTLITPDPFIQKYSAPTLW